LLVESLLLAGFTAVLGIVVAQILSRSLVPFLRTPNNPLFVGLSLDRRLLALTIGVTAATALRFGLLPALRCDPPRLSLRRALLATQVALSIVLLMDRYSFLVRHFHPPCRFIPAHNPALLVDAHHDGMLGWIQIEPDDILQFLGKVFVLTEASTR
jgi:hypothetical protein